jgi:hypothetical protein
MAVPPEPPLPPPTTPGVPPPPAGGGDVPVPPAPCDVFLPPIEPVQPRPQPATSAAPTNIREEK